MVVVVLVVVLVVVMLCGVVLATVVLSVLDASGPKSLSEDHDNGQSTPLYSLAPCFLFCPPHHIALTPHETRLCHLVRRLHQLLPSCHDVTPVLSMISSADAAPQNP